MKQPATAVFLVLVTLAVAAGGDAAIAARRSRPGVPAARARAVILARSALGRGWRAAPAPRRVPPLTCRAFAPRLGSSGQVAKAVSPTFSRTASGPFLSQAAYLFRSSVQAASAWRTLTRPGLLKCLAASLTAGTTRRTTFLVHGRTRLRPLPLGGGAVSDALFRVNGDAETRGTSVKVFLEAVVLKRGPVITELSISSLFRPPRRAAALRFARLIKERLVG